MGYVVSSGQISSYISLIDDYMYVFSGGIANDTTVNSAGRMFLEEGGTANDTIVNEFGSMNVVGTANRTELYGSGYWAPGKMSILNGGVANSTTVNSGGSMDIDKGGVADTTDVNDCGSMHVFSGGVANSTTVNSGGSVYVDVGGTVARAIVYGGGTLDVQKGGTADAITENGGYVNVTDGASVSFAANSFSALTLLNAAATLHSGTTATSTAVNGFGKLYVYANGMANSTTVNSGGNLYLSSGGVANETTVNDFASMHVFDGGAANTATVNSGGSMIVAKGGTAANTVVNECGGLYVSGVVNGTVVNGGGKYDFGELFINAGGAACATTINGFGWMCVDGGGTVNELTVNAGGDLVVSSGGTATAIRENGGYVEVADGANATFAVNEFGSLTLSAGSATVHAGTIANSTTVYTSGELYVYTGGVAKATVLTGTDRSDCAELYVYVGGAAVATTIKAGGWMYIAGEAGSTTVNADGYLGIAAGGIHTGSLTIAEGAVVSAYAGSVIDFGIASVAPESAALVNDLSRITGTPLYALTVSASPEYGTYKLAGGAAGFNQTITVKSDSTGEALGTLTVGKTVNIGSSGYTLNLGSDNVLSVSVGAAAPASAKSDIDGNGISDVMFVWTGTEEQPGNYQHGYWMNGTNTWQSANSNHPAEWENLGCYDMTGDGKADSVLVGNVEVGGVKGAYIGYYADANDLPDGSTWVNIGYLNNADDIVWKNTVGNLTGGKANSIVWYAPELYSLGAWKDGKEDWVNISGNFGGDDWTLVGCGDFNGDGKDSVVMSYNGGQLFYAVGIDGAPQSLGSSNWSGWEVRAIGDFSGDGKDDIVLFHHDTGSMVMCADGNVDSFVSIGQLDAKDWFVVGCGDYNNDQKDDLLVRQYSTGMLGYYSSGDVANGWVEMGRGVDMNWTVIA